jgi:ribosomal protein RSM22 (predicted rRNA methylase)
MIKLPNSIELALDALLKDAPAKDLQTSYADLSNRYRDHNPSSGYRKQEQLAYIAARLPATYGAIISVLKQLPAADYKDCLDLGAGPGTATIAAFEGIPSLQSYTLVEQDRSMSILSQSICNEIPNCTFEVSNILNKLTYSAHDLVILGYVINEHSLDKQLKMIENAWALTKKALILIVPGTPQHFQNLLEGRRLLIEKGAFIAAPCPADTPCPLTGTKDWCHFSVRVERSLKHRHLKKGSLMYEDEKFSYMIATREPAERNARVIKAPIHRKGHVILDTCEEDGIKRETISQRNKENYDKVRKLNWGDVRST